MGLGEASDVGERSETGVRWLSPAAGDARQNSRATHKAHTHSPAV